MLCIVIQKQLTPCLREANIHLLPPQHTHTHSLDALDPNAYAAFQASNDLQDVVDRVLSQRSGTDGGATPGMRKTLSIRAALMTPVKPMLVRTIIPLDVFEFDSRKANFTTHLHAHRLYVHWYNWNAVHVTSMYIVGPLLRLVLIY